MRISSLIIGLSLTLTGLLSAKPTQGQTVTIDDKDVPVKQVFSEIQEQTGLTFVYDPRIVEHLDKISIKEAAKPISKVLKDISEKLPLQFKIYGKIVGVDKAAKALKTEPKPATNVTGKEQPRTVKGKVINDKGVPLAGVIIRIKGTNDVAVTDDKGEYSIDIRGNTSVLIVSFLGYRTQEVNVGDQDEVNIMLAVEPSNLDEVHVIAYGTTSQRFTTGSISKVGAQQIEEQPVDNPIEALEGRVPGLVVTAVSGLPGSAYNVQIRGQNSIDNGSNPLYVIDGVPFNDRPLDVISLGYPSQQSPFNSINPEDIASIEILKDADATAIYGSRGANGVVLITTRKGKPGRTKIDANFFSGFGKVTRTLPMMDESSYLLMRKEAFKNDNVAMTNTNAYDLLAWDTTRNHNWTKELIGGRSSVTNGQVNLSGGNETTQFLAGANYQRQTTVFPGDLGDSRVDVHLNLNHSSVDKKFTFSATASYSNDRNNMIQADLFDNLNLPPDAPSAYKPDGSLNWSENGYYFNNPYAYLLQTYTATTDNLIGNTNIAYKFFEGFTAKVDAGYTYTDLNQVALTPAASQNPQYNPSSYATFGVNGIRGWIVEPQLNYTHSFGKATLEALVGTSRQQQTINGYNIFATGYTSDALLGSTSGASSVSSSSNYSLYRYQAVFGRLHFSWDDKYIINLTGRRDGSSRFGPGRQYANFGAVGAAWLFSQENFIKEAFPFLSFGKLRMSYGITGNDQIGDYRYLDTWYPTPYPYQGTIGLQPYSLYNPNYAWEINKKLEGAIDLGFLKDRVVVSVDYYRNRSSNQLINYTLPGQTGFSGILENLPALVQNKGWEFSLATTNIQNSAFKWSSSFNLTVARNQLLAFPGLESSSYANTYVIGQPLNVAKLFHYLGVDPATGVYKFSGTVDPTDKTSIKDLTPKFYGGFSNSFSYKGFQLDFLFQFVKQLGYNYNRRNNLWPGYIINEPASFLNRWQAPGQLKPTGVYTTGANVPEIYAAAVYLPKSDASVGDASYIRLKNVSLSYSLPSKLLGRIKVENCSVYLRGQNLLTFTNYFGADPENQNSALPPLKILVAGIKITY